MKEDTGVNNRNIYVMLGIYKLENTERRDVTENNI